MRRRERTTATIGQTISKRTFGYDNATDILKVVIDAIIFIILFVVFHKLIKRIEEAELMILLIALAAILGFIFLATIIGRCISIEVNKYKKLTISEAEVTYSYGWLTKKTKTIPISKVRSCSKSSGILQRLCGTMDLGITTAGDVEEIYFCNIEKGEEAYKMISKIIRQ